MRTYPTNSPEAAARILVLALLADGQLSPEEIRTMDRLAAPAELGLGTEAFQHVMRDFCEDLLYSAQLTWSGSCRIDPATLEKLLAEIDQPRLQRQLARLCLAAAKADHHINDAEGIVLGAMAAQWAPALGLSTAPLLRRAA
ncbi:MAG: hypothetical protein RJA44_1237 [Pseudomonadota bacterium]|jgi:uncharacterized tellurite resistance protein B-like protein